MSEKKHVTCPRCGYVWDTKSKMRLVSCPSCMLKVNIADVEKASMEHFNLDANGVKILDRSLATRNSPSGRIIDVTFKPESVQCNFCQSNDCAHVKFALSLPAVNELLKKKGWKPR